MSYKKTFNFRVFLMELMIDILLFALLCACALTLFGKTARITEENDRLQNAISVCNNAEAVFQAGDAYALMEFYEDGIMQNQTLHVGFDTEYHACSPDHATYILKVEFFHSDALLPSGDSHPSDIPHAEITFSKKDGTVIYRTQVYRYKPQTLENLMGGGEHE